MPEQPFSDEVALRIALASRLFPEITLKEFLEILLDYLDGEIDETSLSRITVTNLKTALGQTYELDGEEHGEDANTEEIAAFKQAVRILWGETGESDKLPAIEPYQEGDMPNSIRVAVASNNGEELDGHFGSCLRYLIYQLTAEEIRLVDIRSALEAELSEDKNRFRVNLIKDCPILYIVAIGGPAAAKVIQGGIYPMKKEKGGSAREVLVELQRALATSPPPWLAKILGVAPGDRIKNYKALTV
ncbi:dinitrogenase iron-molybdenum cofactor biosynthesis protein [Phormidium sp. LEGE 05292]|uniref:dinitrogenase iron-molybdenum cofactor biosynthesis protein n=1 Tax=[Phormidium] sp. LEGE 05292 TaxID=767427 RepID=UPI0018800AF0|nr:dinitrogenase iron-molybdenum cofactor biosynthesis protein [Phormidium sp. LEGE 05292]MBE9229051.1 dinitrogenase iron-molybdenum cofactor biosynthesis protein [Phormidium sp. LEGE 05292]